MYVDHWNQIASSTGKGVENVMEVYEDYLNVLMQNFVDTFTRPFEVVEKNIGIFFIFSHINKYRKYYINYMLNNLSQSCSPGYTQITIHLEQ